MPTEIGSTALQRGNDEIREYPATLSHRRFCHSAGGKHCETFREFRYVPICDNWCPMLSE